FDLGREIKIPCVMRRVCRLTQMQRNCTGTELAIDAEKILDYAARFKLDIRGKPECEIDHAESRQIAVQPRQRVSLVLKKIESEIESDRARLYDLDVFGDQWTLLCKRGT